MNRRCRDEGVDAASRCILQGIASTADIRVVRACKSADDAVLDGAGDGLYGLEVTVARGREAGLDHVDSQPLELPRNAHLLVARHGCTGTLLAIPKGGIEYDQSVFHVLSPSRPEPVEFHPRIRGGWA